jgi:hypothetical protein
MKYVMNSKDFRILPHQPGLDENTDYVPISKEDAEAVMAGKKNGRQILKEMFLKSRMEEINTVPEKPAEDAKTDKGDETPKLDEPPKLDFSTMTKIGLHTLLVGDLRTFAKERFGIVFPPATGKDKMIAALSEKMDDAKTENA